MTTTLLNGGRPVSNPAERADKVREQLQRLADIINGLHPEARLVPPHGQSSATPLHLIQTVLPPGSLILTAEEAETIRGALDLSRHGILTSGVVDKRDEAFALLSPEKP